MSKLIISAALLLGCGSAQHAVGPDAEVLTGEAPARQPTERDTWCRPPEGFPQEIMLITGEWCWIQLDTTQAECARLKREERHPHMLYDGRCWFLRARRPQRQPTSSLTILPP
ncbi:MAG: hypothetical protein JXB05_01320 [Myxococcaceae bacterium]|nr:hypothetical protein [Myxococcaceae bacterium]